MDQPCIIIGASHAAAQLAPSLRQEGWQGPITVIGDESSIPYHRPPLSKAYLLGEKAAADLLIRSHQAYEQQCIDFRLGEWVESIDCASHTLLLRNGQTLGYAKLAICTGARARKATLPGSHLRGVSYLRSMADIDQIKKDVRPGGAAVIIGGGYIGLETAAVLRMLGMNVIVLEVAPRVLARVTSPETSRFFARVHAEEGVEVLTDMAVVRLEGRQRVERVICANGQVFDTELVIIGIGVLPNVELAEQAGLLVRNGIVVDDCARTSDPDIVAVGDCTAHPSPWYGEIRLESVPNATEQAKSAAAALCGKSKPYATLPWSWSDQYDIKLQIAGLNHGYDQVAVRGNSNMGRSFCVFYLRQGQLIAADCVNRPQEFIFSKRLIAERIEVSVAQLVDETLAFKSLLSGKTVTPLP